MGDASMLALALTGSAFLMGAAGSVHCAAMCAAPCAAVTGGRSARMTAFHAGRVLGYAAGGALAAASVGGLLRWEVAANLLRPVWLALHLAVLALGVYLMWRAEQPRWVQQRWRPPMPAEISAPSAALAAGGIAWAAPMRMAGAVGAGGAGLAWLAWPCGLLQSALMVAALAEGPWQGAGVMAAFALGSSPGLLAGPWLLARLGRFGGGRGVRWAARLSGALLAAGALWALGHGLWTQIRAYCG